MQQINQFLERMQKHSTEKLLDILFKSRAEYQDEAIEAVEMTLKERGIDINDYKERMDETSDEEEVAIDNQELDDHKYVGSFEKIIEAGKEEFDEEGGEEFVKKVRFQKNVNILFFSVGAILVIASLVLRVAYGVIPISLVLMAIRVIAIRQRVVEKTKAYRKIQEIRKEIGDVRIDVDESTDLQLKKMYKLIALCKKSSKGTEQLVNYLPERFDSKEELEKFEVLYKYKYYTELYEELKGLSNSYETIKRLLHPYIKFSLVEASYPYDRIEGESNVMGSTPLIINKKAEQLYKLIRGHKEGMQGLDQVINFLRDEFVTIEDCQNTVDYFYKYNIDLYEELKNLSNSYNTIKNLMYPFIHFNMVESNYPHKIIE